MDEPTEESHFLVDPHSDTEGKRDNAVMDEPDAWPGRIVHLGDDQAPVELVELPFYDPERLIPRGRVA